MLDVCLDMSYNHISCDAHQHLANTPTRKRLLLTETCLGINNISARKILSCINTALIIQILYRFTSHNIIAILLLLFITIIKF